MEIITSIEQQLKWCVCCQGCHMCSGTQHSFGSNIQPYYQEYIRAKREENIKGREKMYSSFENWCYNIQVTPVVLKQLEEKYGK